jgi:anaerobic magnesium-protoporphyrin IX monomethyl ester cyclase
LRGVPGLRPLYVDGTIVPLPSITELITSQAESILAVCVGALSANYEAGLLILEHAKRVDSAIVTVVGNDHFTALSEECITNAAAIDFGFVGNEVVGPFTSLVADLFLGNEPTPSRYPGLVYRDAHAHVRYTPQKHEVLFTSYDYGLIDSAFEQTSIYYENFGARVSPRISELLGRKVSRGIPVDIGRGCIKFANNDACSFCSIQFGGLWKNELSPAEAWHVIRHAVDAGHDYLYLPADERPVIVGYARADGIASEARTRKLLQLGIRQVMIGMDAGSPSSLAAMNKPLTGRRQSIQAQSELLFRKNSEALRVASDNGMLIRAGFVIGHLGMTRELLQENLDMIRTLLRAGRHSITAVDVEVLSPQPGALDFKYLVDPDLALATADRLSLPVDEGALPAVARKWRGRHVVPPEEAMRDYVRVLMPEIDFDDMVEARLAVRAEAKANGIIIGE